MGAIFRREHRTEGTESLIRYSHQIHRIGKGHDALAQLGVYPGMAHEPSEGANLCVNDKQHKSYRR
jgi:hypothetical protein